MEKYIETTMKNLERNNIKPFYVEKREEVVPLIKTLVKKVKAYPAAARSHCTSARLTQKF